MAIPIFGLGV